MILSTLAPVIAHPVSEYGSIVVECAARDRLIAALHCLLSSFKNISIKTRADVFNIYTEEEPINKIIEGIHKPFQKPVLFTDA